MDIQIFNKIITNFNLDGKMQFSRIKISEIIFIKTGENT